MAGVDSHQETVRCPSAIGGNAPPGTVSPKGSVVHSFIQSQATHHFPDFSDFLPEEMGSGRFPHGPTVCTGGPGFVSFR